MRDLRIGDLNEISIGDFRAPFQHSPDRKKKILNLFNYGRRTRPTRRQFRSHDESAACGSKSKRLLRGLGNSNKIRKF